MNYGHGCLLKKCCRRAEGTRGTAALMNENMNGFRTKAKGEYVQVVQNPVLGAWKKVTTP